MIKDNSTNKGFWVVEFCAGCRAEWARFDTKGEALAYAKANDTLAEDGGGHLDVWYKEDLA